MADSERFIDEIREHMIESKDANRIAEILSKYPTNSDDCFNLLCGFINMQSPLDDKDRSIVKAFLETKIYYQSGSYNLNENLGYSNQHQFLEFFMDDLIDIELLKLAKFQPSTLNYSKLLEEKFNEISLSGVDNISRKDKELIGYLLERSPLPVQKDFYNRLIEMLETDKVDVNFIKALDLNIGQEAISHLKDNLIGRISKNSTLYEKLLDSGFPLKKIGIERVPSNEMQIRIDWFKAVDNGDIDKLSQMIKKNNGILHWENVDQSGFIISGETALAKAITQDVDDKVLFWLLSRGDFNLDQIYKGKTLGEHILLCNKDPEIFIKNEISYRQLSRNNILNEQKLSDMALLDPGLSLRLDAFGARQSIRRLRVDSIENFSQHLPKFNSAFINQALKDIENILDSNSILVRFKDRKEILLLTREFLTENITFDKINADGTVEIKIPDNEKLEYYFNQIRKLADLEDLNKYILNTISTSANAISFMPYQSENGLRMAINNETLELALNPKQPEVNWKNLCSLDSYEHFTKDNEEAFWYTNEEQQTLLKPPTIALILDYYKNKNKNDPEKGNFDNVYIVNSYKDLSEILDICDDMESGRIVKILFQGEDQGFHCNLIVFRKNEDRNELFLFESTGLNPLYLGQFLRQVSSSLTFEQLFRTSVYCNENARQSDSISCSIFSVTDCKHIEKNEHYLDSFVDRAKPSDVTEYMTKHPMPGRRAEFFTVPIGLSVASFQLPAIFMGLTQSSSIIKKFEEQHGTSHESLKNKNVKDDSLMLYAFKNRHKENRISTPITSPSGKLINNSADYFKDKYLSYIKEEVKNKSDAEIYSKIQRFDARCHLDDIKALSHVDSYSKADRKK